MFIELIIIGRHFEVCYLFLGLNLQELAEAMLLSDLEQDTVSHCCSFAL